MKKDFSDYTYLVQGEEKLKAWLESGHDWECYYEDEGGKIINVTAGQWKDNHEKCNGPKCLKCGYNPCWHCEPMPIKCPPAEEDKQNMDNLLKEKIDLAWELGGILQKYRDLGAEILIENASTFQEIDLKVGSTGISLPRSFPLQEKYIITIVLDYPKIGKEVSNDG